MGKKKTVRASFSDIPEVTEAVVSRFEEVKKELGQGKTVEEAIDEVKKRRETVIRNLVALRYDFIGYLESTIGRTGRIASRFGIKTEDGYLKKAIESYKEQDYNFAVSYCDGALSVNFSSARAFALRGFVQAIRINPDYSEALDYLYEAVRLDSQNNFYKSILKIIEEAV